MRYEEIKLQKKIRELSCIDFYLNQPIYTEKTIS